MHTTVDSVTIRPATTTAPPSAMYLAGARAITPMVLGIVPFGLAIGSAAAALDVDPTAAWAGSWLILAGSAHLTVIQLIDDGAAPLVAIAAALMINARFTVYSAGLAEWFPAASRRARLLLALPLVDQLYLTAVARFERRDLDELDRRRFYVGAAIHLAVAWVIAQTIGVLIGDRLPPWMALHHAGLLALSGLLARSLTSRRAQCAAAVAALTALAGSGLPNHSVVLVALLAGMSAGTTWRQAS